MQWFSVLRLFLTEFSPSEEVTAEIFSTFSAYFPVSLRSSNHPSGITADDLKLALRQCFAAHYRVAKHSFPFLIQKLDQGEGVSVNVKVCSQFSSSKHETNMQRLMF
jgi:DNA repair/transcription protein MET18/MMS19